MQTSIHHCFSHHLNETIVSNSIQLYPILTDVRNVILSVRLPVVVTTFRFRFGPNGPKSRTRGRGRRGCRPTRPYSWCETDSMALYPLWMAGKNSMNSIDGPWDSLPGKHRDKLEKIQTKNYFSISLLFLLRYRCSASTFSWLDSCEPSIVESVFNIKIDGTLEQYLKNSWYPYSGRWFTSCVLFSGVWHQSCKLYLRTCSIVVYSL